MIEDNERVLLSFPIELIFFVTSTGKRGVGKQQLFPIFLSCVLELEKGFGVVGLM